MKSYSAISHVFFITMLLFLSDMAYAGVKEVTIGALKYRLNTEELTASLIDCNDSKLTELIIPETVTDPNDGNPQVYTVTSLGIFPGGTGGLYQIKSVFIPSTIKEIMFFTLQDLFPLDEIRVDVGNTEFTSVDGVLFNKEITQLLVFPNQRKGAYNVPEGVKSIGGGAFYASHLQKLVLPSTLLEIQGSMVFEFCLSMDTLICYMPDPDQFKMSDSFPNSISTVLVPYFSYEKYINSNNRVWSQIREKIQPLDPLTPIGDWNKCMTFDFNEVELTATMTGFDLKAVETTNVVIPDTIVFKSGNTGQELRYAVKAMSDNVFVNYSSDTIEFTVTLPKTMETIGQGCFYCINNIIFPDDNNLQYIGAGAFERCMGLKDVNLPAVKHIGESAFRDCRSLERVSLSNHIDIIYGSCFSGCYNLEFIEVGEDNPYLTSDSFGLFNKDRTQLLLFFPNATSGTEILIPEGVKTLSQSAFRNVYYGRFFNSIHFPASFESFTSLQYNFAPDFVEFYSVAPSNKKFTALDGVLFDKDMKTLINYPYCKKDRDYAVPEGVEEIANYNFRNHPYLECVTLPETLVKVGDWCFCLGGAFTHYSYTKTNIENLGIIIGLQNSLRFLEMRSKTPPLLSESSFSFDTKYDETGPTWFEQPYTVMLVPEDAYESYKQVSRFDKNWHIVTSISKYDLEELVKKAEELYPVVTETYSKELLAECIERGKEALDSHNEAAIGAAITKLTYSVPLADAYQKLSELLVEFFQIVDFFDLRGKVEYFTDGSLRYPWGYEIERADYMSETITLKAYTLRQIQADISTVEDYLKRLANETGIDVITAKANVADEFYYDMVGRKMQSKPERGIYIYKGKKYFVK